MHSRSETNKDTSKLTPAAVRTTKTHVVIIDGTLSSLEPGKETNAGLAYKLLSELADDVSVHYIEGLQCTNLRTLLSVLTGRGINGQIRKAYGYLASQYRPGDRIFLMGFSRGAYAVRSLAGIIDRIGLLKAGYATSKNIRNAYWYYECTPDSEAAQRFARLHCYDHVPISMIGVWDTVKSLGINAPILWRLTLARNAFHNHELGASVESGFQALAMNETRVAYSPVMWEDDAHWSGRLEQMWFRGAHGDIGGEIGRHQRSRPLSNIPLVWILEKAESCGLPFPSDWRERFPRDADAPTTGTWSGLAKVLIMRKRRIICTRPSEAIHPSAQNSSVAKFRTERTLD